MIEFEPGGRSIEPPRGPSGGQAPGGIRRVPAGQFYHFQWHLLRVQGPACCTFRPTHGAHPSIPARVVTGFFIGLHMRGAAELREFLPGPDRKAQIALSVENAWQGRGIGTALMAEALRVARERGIAKVHLTCHALNHRMQRIAEKFEARIGFEGCECFAEITLRDKASATGP